MNDGRLRGRKQIRFLHGNGGKSDRLVDWLRWHLDLGMDGWNQWRIPPDRSCGVCQIDQA
jgi:hypothetical protein